MIGDMKIDFPVEKTITARHSVRGYKNHPLSTPQREDINKCIKQITNPFSSDVTFHLLNKSASEAGEKIGTYGVIKGASDFVGASAAPGELSLEAIGYAMEIVILHLTSLGLGTCWLGGTFDRSGFARAMKLKEGNLFPVISPIGYPEKKQRFMDSMARRFAKSDHRFEWNQLFFQEDFSHPLTKSAAGDYAFPLEMLRLAPSAANKQPWRIVQVKNTYHFYEARSLKDNKHHIDIQRTDVGIGACHFHLAALELNLQGKFVKLPIPKIEAPEKTYYLFSWVTDTK